MIFIQNQLQTCRYCATANIKNDVIKFFQTNFGKTISIIIAKSTYYSDGVWHSIVRWKFKYYGLNCLIHSITTILA